MTTEKMSVEQALDLMRDVYMTRAQREAFDTLRAEVEGMKAAEREAFISGYKHGACHYIGGDDTQELHEAAAWAAENRSPDAGIFDRAREVPREGE